MRRKPPIIHRLLVYFALIAATQGMTADNSFEESKIDAGNTPTERAYDFAFEDWAFDADGFPREK